MLRTFFSETLIIKQKYKPQTGRKYLKYIYNEKRLVSKSYKKHGHNITIIIIITITAIIVIQMTWFFKWAEDWREKPAYERVYVNDN